ncbi:MAG TPA: VOC family protein [Candidatus Limnocylindrales bacterium]|nr:VOC family protein [Candidatus Limnocylindrales bacterium]
MAFPQAETSVTTLLVVSDLERSTTWYRDVLGATVVGGYEGSAVLRLLDTWLLLVVGGGPTADKPTVTFAPPADPARVATEVIFGVADCRSAYAALEKRGVAFLTPPVEYDWVIRAFFRDPDGHLFEISQRKR